MKTVIAIEMDHVDVLGVAHQSNPVYVKYVWWYSILEDIMEGYSLEAVEKHASSKFKIINNDFNKCARGRVILFKKKFYLLIWTPGYRHYNSDILEKIISRIEDKFNIDYVIDESGQELC